METHQVEFVKQLGGLLNSIGLQNPGIEYFLENDLPWLRKQDIAVIVNAGGNTAKEYTELCKILNDADIDGVELNISCPNVKSGGMAFGTSCDSAGEITRNVRNVLKDKPLIVKLSPNVTDIVSIAKTVENAGADGISLINTLLGMSINIETRKPNLGNNIGGLSGPAIKPVAVRMVYQASSNVKIPVLGMGGIMNGKDAIEFMMAGAKGVAVGSATLRDPLASVKVVEEIEEYMKLHSIENINSIVGTVELN